MSGRHREPNVEIDAHFYDKLFLAGQGGDVARWPQSHKPVFFDGGGMAMKSQKAQKKDDWTGDGWITLRTVTRGPEYLQDVRSSSLGIMRKARKRDRVEEECLGSVITMTDRNIPPFQKKKILSLGRSKREQKKEKRKEGKKKGKNKKNPWEIIGELKSNQQVLDPASSTRCLVEVDAWR